MISKIHPTRSHSGAAEGGINAALGNASEDNPEIHAFDTVKGSDYLGDQDAIQILCDEAPADVYQLENWGAVFSRTDDGRIAQRPFGAAGAPRTAYAADITGHVLIQVLWEQVCKRDIPTYEEYFAWHLVENDGRCQGVVCWDLLDGGLKTIGCEDRDPRDRRCRPALHRDDERLLLHGRRDGDGTAHRSAAQGHGDDAVPPHDARADGRAHHRGLPRRGRVSPQQGRRALPQALRAEHDGARVARRHLARRADGDRRRPRRRRQRPARSPPPRRRAHHRAAAGVARARDDVPRRRSDLRPDPRATGRPLPHGWHRDRRLGTDRARRACTPPASAHASRCTAPTGSAATRSWRRSRTGSAPARTRPSGRSRTRRSTSPTRPSATRRRSWRRCSSARTASVRSASATSSPPRCTRTSASSAASARWRSRAEIVAGLRERYQRVLVEDKGEVFNSDLTQAIELGFLLDLAECMVVAGHRAEREPRRPRAAGRLSGARRREFHEAHDGAAGRRHARALVGGRADDEMGAAGEEVLMQVALKIWRYDSVDGRPGAQGVRDRRARVGDAPRLPRHRQGPARRLARVPQELPDDDLRLVRDADGRRRRARLQDADVRHRAGGPGAGHLGDGEPADPQGPRRRHGSVLGRSSRR